MIQRLNCIYLTVGTLDKTENIAKDLEKKNSNKLHNIRGFLLKKSTDVSNISQVMIWVESASIIKQKMLLFHVWSI